MNAATQSMPANLPELLGITGDNQHSKPNLGALVRLMGDSRAVRHEPVTLDSWYTAPFAASVMFDYVRRELHTGERPEHTFPALMELFSGAFWREAGWGRFLLLGQHDQHSEPRLRELAEDPAWVHRGNVGHWALHTAAHRTGFIGVLSFDHRRMAVWFNMETSG